MNARSQELLDQLRALSLEERDAVAAELCEGVARDSAQTPDPAWIDELERRTRTAKAGLSQPISREEARARVETALRAKG